jgi:hypothetical protein
MEKMPHRGDIQVRPHTAVRRAGIPAPSTIRRTISSSRGRRSGPGELQRGSRTPRQADTQRQWDVISMSHRSDLGAEAYPLTVLSETTWTTCSEAA